MGARSRKFPKDPLKIVYFPIYLIHLYVTAQADKAPSTNELALYVRNMQVQMKQNVPNFFHLANQTAKNQTGGKRDFPLSCTDPSIHILATHADFILFG